MSLFQIEAIVFFKPIVAGGTFTRKTTEQIRTHFKSAGFCVFWDDRGADRLLIIRANNLKFNRIFGVELQQTLISAGAATEPVYADKSNPSVRLYGVQLPIGFGGEESVQAISFTTYTPPALVKHANAPPAPAPAHTARQGDHAPDVPVELAAEKWFVYPYEMRRYLNVDASAQNMLTQNYRSSENTLIHFVDSGVDKSHPYFLTRFGTDSYNRIQLVNTHSVNLRDPDRITVGIIDSLKNLLNEFNQSIQLLETKGIIDIPDGLVPGKPLRDTIARIKHHNAVLSLWVDQLFTSEAALRASVNATITVDLKSTRDKLGEVHHWANRAYLEYKKQKRSDFSVDYDGHGTQMVAAAKSVAPDARVVMWQTGTGSITAGLAHSVIDRLKIQRMKPLSVVGESTKSLLVHKHRTHRKRRILACSWGESVPPKKRNLPANPPVEALRNLATEKVTSAHQRGYLVIFAAGNAHSPEAPQVSCFAETGSVGTLVVGGGWLNQGTTATLSDTCHGFTHQKYDDDVSASYAMAQPVPNVLGLCAPMRIKLSAGGTAFATCYTMLPSSSNMAGHKDHWDAKDATGKSLGVWNRNYNGSSGAAAQVKDYLVRGSKPCVAGESYQGVHFDDLVDSSTGKQVGLVDVAASINLKRTDDTIKNIAPTILDILVPVL